MGTRSRFALIALAVLVAVLLVAVPAQAGTVKSGSTHLTMGAKYVTEARQAEHPSWRRSRRRR